MFFQYIHLIFGGVVIVLQIMILKYFNYISKLSLLLDFMYCFRSICPPEYYSVSQTCLHAQPADTNCSAKSPTKASLTPTGMDDSSVFLPHPKYTLILALVTLLSPYSFAYMLPSLRPNAFFGGQNHVWSGFSAWQRVDIQLLLSGLSE